MAHKMHLWLSAMYYTLCDHFPDVLHADSIPPSFKPDQADAEFLHDSHLLIWSITTNLSL